MHRREIDRLIGKVDRSGYALVPLDLHFVKGRVKLALALGRGKREFEKRDDESKREWKRDQSRLMKTTCAAVNRGRTTTTEGSSNDKGTRND